MIPEIAQRLAEIRACDNVGAVHLVADAGSSVLVLLVPRDPDAEPQLLLLNPALRRDQVQH